MLGFGLASRDLQAVLFVFVLVVSVFVQSLNKHIVFLFGRHHVFQNCTYRYVWGW